MTSVCPKCKLRAKVPRLIVGSQLDFAPSAVCRVCGTEWWPYNPSEVPTYGVTPKEELQ